MFLQFDHGEVILPHMCYASTVKLSPIITARWNQ